MSACELYALIVLFSSKVRYDFFEDDSGKAKIELMGGYMLSWFCLSRIFESWCWWRTILLSSTLNEISVFCLSFAAVKDWFKPFWCSLSWRDYLELLEREQSSRVSRCFELHNIYDNLESKPSLVDLASPSWPVESCLISKWCWSSEADGKLGLSFKNWTCSSAF